MSALSTAAGVNQPGCCQSSLVLQTKLAQTPICSICFDPLVVADEEFSNVKDVVVWKRCG